MASNGGGGGGGGWSLAGSLNESLKSSLANISNMDITTVVDTISDSASSSLSRVTRDLDKTLSELNQFEPAAAAPVAVEFPPADSNPKEGNGKDATKKTSKKSATTTTQRQNTNSQGEGATKEAVVPRAAADKTPPHSPPPPPVSVSAESTDNDEANDLNDANAQTTANNAVSTLSQDDRLALLEEQAIQALGDLEESERRLAESREEAKALRASLNDVRGETEKTRLRAEEAERELREARAEAKRMERDSAALITSQTTSADRRLNDATESAQRAVADLRRRHAALADSVRSQMQNGSQALVEYVSGEVRSVLASTAGRHSAEISRLRLTAAEAEEARKSAQAAVADERAKSERRAKSFLQQKEVWAQREAELGKVPVSAPDPALATIVIDGITYDADAVASLVSRLEHAEKLAVTAQEASSNAEARLSHVSDEFATASARVEALEQAREHDAGVRAQLQARLQSAQASLADARARAEAFETPILSTAAGGASSSPRSADASPGASAMEALTQARSALAKAAGSALAPFDKADGPGALVAEVLALAAAISSETAPTAPAASRGPLAAALAKAEDDLTTVAERAAKAEESNAQLRSQLNTLKLREKELMWQVRMAGSQASSESASASASAAGGSQGGSQGGWLSDLVLRCTQPRQPSAAHSVK